MARDRRRQRRESLNAFLFDVEKWFGSTAQQRMSFAEKGVYLVMMFQEWRGGSLPDDVEAMIELIAVSETQADEVRAAWPLVRRKFVTHEKDPKWMQNVSLENTRRKQRRRLNDLAASGKKGGEAKAAKAPADRQLEAVASLQPCQPSLQPPVAPLQQNVAIREREEEREDPIRRDIEPEREKAPPSLSPPADPFLDPVTTDRAAGFLDRYERLYPKHRHGARYARKPVRDYAAAVTLCQTWADDGRLDKLATIFLTTDHKFAEEGSRTVPQFLALASWCDGKLAEHEAKRAAV